ncbi:hypothetical protein I4P28_07255 [Enterobacter kobei]|uniref:Gp49 family protein n=1 Tax=Enterobacter kobei TaxID=208224 RepID=UPI0018C323CB|nr:hypothetical protein [Enterobacter kobei]
MSDKDIEQEIQAKGLTAPRITPQHIEGVIVHEMYLSPADRIHWTDSVMAHGNEQKEMILRSISCLTICVLTLKNGFTVTGESACASPENFDAEIGRKIARENAVNKIWMLEGYLLKQKLSEV